MLTGLFKNAEFGPPPNLHTSISLVEVCRFGQCLGWRFPPIYIFFSIACFRAFSDAAHSRFFLLGSQTMLTGLFKNASFGPPPNLHKRISLVEVY